MCKERYVNPFTDFGFKRLFGTEANKDILIHFLNAVLENEEDIVDLTYHNVEKLGPSERDRRAIYDIYCKTASGDHIIVEMQRGWQEHFVERCIYYSSMAVTDAAAKGDWDFNLPRVYTIALLNFEPKEFADSRDFKHTWGICDTKTGKVSTKALNYVFLEMKKFKKGINELETLTDKWMYVINNLYLLDEYPSAITEKIFKRFFKEAKISAFTEEERFAYEESLKEMRDYNNTIASTAKAKFAEGMTQGMAQGMAQGMVQGRVEEKYNMARLMKNAGEPVEKISAYTGLDKEEIRNL